MPGTFARTITADRKLVVPEIYLGLTLACWLWLLSRRLSLLCWRVLVDKGGNERDQTDRRKLSVNGLYAHFQAGMAHGC